MHRLLEWKNFEGGKNLKDSLEKTGKTPLLGLWLSNPGERLHGETEMYLGGRGDLKTFFP